MFISFEGLDGSGKTTILNKLVHKLSHEYPHVKFILTREPGGKNVPEAEKLRSIILDPETKISHVSEALLYSASRRMHLEKVIWPAIERGEIVLCDRYVDSFYAYQGFARKLGYEYTKQMTELVIDGTMPDITIFFDINPEQSRQRREANRLVVDRLENEAFKFHDDVYQGYKYLINEDPQRFIVIDATQSAEQVFQNVWKALLENSKFKDYWQKHA
ncbi:dTMP kinase [Mycoplasmopsis gallopavonis]|uniref:Thymidylate kinase n=1 Tax=Mycoplasmopsis gallopavonis TaxID=76629 RepID=A0A449AZI7_9BACT|nr:dTMP kinase [Mycoplasmopsis gallopavonis]RIV16705.1 dTMP kinase [Mycoplasmopsis gallopavonis]VEU72933.1 Thymidylate kinase [Mycoplasmopsis gallopavonis]